ncbi:RDD family protein [Burkholderia multivorans]|uniref:RDD family protein n=1 Tax=Burkholderia multivorans TaxID=87883 RepID=A0ABD7LIQ6_9BURK|nr:RDD family protein [Burkholderia multivorans]SAK16207.1 RDD family protein [Burkholderia multivorans]SAK18666.1 RDD family protein [Burkholderia multivorans]HEF5155953.1 RDD family protein [Burkholderia multivorans]
MADTSALPAAAAVPSVRRRLAAMLYEAVLLFGVVFFAGLAFGLAMQQRNGLVHHNLLAAWIALVVGAYFVWFWTHGGQTLPMKTWRLRLEAANGRPLSAGHAIVRYVLGWLWFLPPLALHPLLGLSVPVTLALAAAWIVVWAGAARLHADRQFPHDRLARTRIVAMPR